MAELAAFLTLLNSLSPLAVIGLLGTVIFLLVKGKTHTARELKVVQTNHLHELPEIAETLRSMSDTLRRMETRMAEDFSHIKAKLNGR